MISPKIFEPIKDRMMAVGLSESEVNAEISFAVQTINSSRQLSSASEESMLKAMVNLCNCGLSLNTVKNQAFLKPKSKKVGNDWITECTFEAQYQGLVDLLIAQGVVKKLNTQIVYEKDNFKIDLGNDTKPVSHSPYIMGDRGKPLIVYTVAHFDDGTSQVEYMPMSEVEQIREMSDGYKAYLKDSTKSTPWVGPLFGEMAKKTCIRRIYKRLPKGKNREKVDNIIAHENQDFGANERQKQYILDLCVSANLSPEEVQMIEASVDGYTFDQAHGMIQYLKDNQMSDDPRYNGGQGSITAMKQAVNDAVERDNT